MFIRKYVWGRHLTDLKWDWNIDINEKANKENNVDELQVHQARESDVLRDIIRLHRDEIEKRKLQKYKHNLVVLKLNNRKKSVWLRTLEPVDLERFREYQTKKISSRDKERFKEDYKTRLIINPDRWITVDERLRDYFDVDLFGRYNFQINNAGILQRMGFYSKHSDPIIRYSFYLALLSVFIGIIAIIISVFK